MFLFKWWWRFLFLITSLVAMMNVAAQASPISDVLLRLESPNPSKRAVAAVELGKIGEMAHVSSLVPLLADKEAVVREAAYDSIWQIWMRSGDPEIDSLMKKGVTLMNLGQFEAAIDVFSEMIRKKPSFAEGWNKRATVLFMAKRYQESVADCNKTLELNPYHFGALSGLGMNYVELQDLDGALDAFKRTLELLPHSKSTAKYIEILEKKIAEKRKRI